MASTPDPLFGDPTLQEHTRHLQRRNGLPGSCCMLRPTAGPPSFGRGPPLVGRLRLAAEHPNCPLMTLFCGENQEHIVLARISHANHNLATRSSHTPWLALPMWLEPGKGARRHTVASAEATSHTVHALLTHSALNADAGGA